MASKEDIWPSGLILVSDRVKQLITRFFEISDSAEPTSGRLMADEVFAKDAIFTTHKESVFRGHDEIATSRGKNNPAITSRAHQLVRIYAADSPATDLLVLGNFKLGFKDGSNVVFDFNARMIIAAGQGEEEKLQFVQVWTDPTDMIAALKKATETRAA